MTGRSAQLASIIRTDLRRLARDKVALFFIAVLPFIVILALGSFVGDAGDGVQVAVVDLDQSDRSAELRDRVAAEDRVNVAVGSDERVARRDLQLGFYSGVLVIPSGYGDDLAGGSAEVRFLVDRTRATSELAVEAVSTAVDELGRAVAVIELLADQGIEEPADRVTAAESVLEASPVVVEVMGDDRPGGSSLAFVAGGQLLLFMFVNSLAAGAALIEMRRFGVAQRLLSGPLDAGDIVTGVALARLLVAVTFGGVVAALAVVIYDVEWGSLAVLAGVIVLFALVSTGAATLIGAALDDPDAATSVGIPVGLALAALGGCMFPIWIAPDAIQLASKILTPHAWAVDALMSASFDGSGVGDLWTNFAVLTLWAVVLLAAGRLLAQRRLRTA